MQADKMIYPQQEIYIEISSAQHRDRHSTKAQHQAESFPTGTDDASRKSHPEFGVEDHWAQCQLLDFQPSIFS